MITVVAPLKMPRAKNDTEFLLTEKKAKPARKTIETL
jgi:hypothetical protein